MKIRMTMDEIKRAIVKAFKDQYGFAPAMKSIIPLEGSGFENEYTWIGFAVGGIGYEYDTLEGLTKSEAYDFVR